EPSGPFRSSDVRSMSMNDETRDVLVGAVLDGEATEAEVARVRADPSLAARLDELAAVRSRLQVESLPPAGAADAAVTAALAAVEPTAVVPLVAHRRWRRAAPVLAAAAALLVVLLGVVALTRPAQHSTTA